VELTGQTVIVAAKDQVSCDLTGEAMILSLKRGMYYSLDPVGASIWKLLERPVAIADIRDALLEEYDVGRSRCESDLHEFLRQLAAEGLIEVRESRH